MAGDVGGAREPVLLRLKPGVVEWLTAEAKLAGVSRSELIRDLLRVGIERHGKPTPRSDIASSSAAVALNTADIAELRWWRQFADRTVVNGDPDRQVEPGIDLAGWTFYMAPEYDEHLKAIS